MGMAYGIFKENYRGYGIYWRGLYNVEGSEAEYHTITAAREAVDQQIAESEEQQKAQIMAGNHLVARRDGDNVSVETPDGLQSYTIQQFRSEMWTLEAKYNMVVAWM